MLESIAVYLTFGLTFSLCTLFVWNKNDSAVTIARVFALFLLGWGVLIVLFALDFIFLVILGYRYEAYSRAKLRKLFDI